MSYFRYFLVLFILFSFSKSFSQNDCTDALVVCGNTGFSGLSATGFGTQELAGNNSCGSSESNSIWLKISINQGGTLGFILTPESSNIGVDFDFFIYGPNVTCGAIGQSIRCSTTNPQASGASSNTTGLRDSESDTAEGPGAAGNSFVKSLTVADGDTYYLIIDRPEGSSNFSLTWTGTATFVNPPVLNVPAGAGINIEECDIDLIDDQKTIFNLTQNTPIIKGNQTGVAVTYHLNSNDAIVGENAITNANSFPNTTNPQTVFARITNIISGCFNTTDFKISVINTVKIPGISYSICDDNADGNSANGLATFNFNNATTALMDGENGTGLIVKYYATSQNALNGVNPLPNNYTNTTPNQQNVFIKVTNPDNCFKIKEITLIVQPLPIVVNTTLIQCDPGFSPDGFTLFNLNESLTSLTNNDSNFAIAFSYNGTAIESNYTNVSNPQQIQAVIKNKTTGCSSTSNVNLIVNLVNPIVSIPPVCDDENNEDGFAPFNLNSSSLILTPTQTLVFYETLNDALLEENPILSTTNYVNLTAFDATVYFRIEEQNKCNGIGVLNLKVNKLPNIATTPDQVYYVCENLPLKFISLNAQILAGTSTDFTYQWFKDNVALVQNTYSILVNKAGSYSVIVTNGEGCKKTRIITVLNSSNASIDSVLIDDLNPEKNSITVILNPASIGDFVYTLDYADGFYQTSNFFDNVSMGFHTIYVKDLNGCGTVQKSVAIVGAPKFFTPNGDSFNDYWKIEGISKYFSPSAVTYVYDRFGKFIHKIFALDNGWDGTYNGTPLPADDYWYVINLEDGRMVKGHFSLKR